MKRIVFLDFDGVMDTGHHCNRLNYQGLPENDKYGVLFDPDCVKNLERIIEETGAEIVVTSSWKDWMSYEQFLQMWKDRNLPGFVTDTTPSCSNHRGDEISSWLSLFSKIENGAECRYVIIDDMGEADFNKDQVSHLVSVDSFYGLNEKACLQAISILCGGIPIEQ